MLERVLVATDFSPGAGAALDRALRLPLAPDARVEVLHVVPDYAGEARKARTAAQLETELSRTRAAAPDPDVQLVGRSTRGAAHVEIIRAARAADAELIVVGVHGKRRLRDLVIGSTASRVVRHGELPILLVRQPAAAPYRTPLVAVALTDADPQLFRLVRRIGIERPNVVHAVHVPFEGLQASTRAARDALRIEYCKAAATRLRPVLDEVDPTARWNPTIQAGDARTIVVDEARRMEADLLICGTHGRSGLSHTLLGSVAESLIAMAPCDVLVARPTRFTFQLP